MNAQAEVLELTEGFDDDDIEARLRSAHARIGTLSIRRGNYADRRLLILDLAPICKQKCKVADRCDAPNPGKPCRIILTMTNTIEVDFFRRYRELESDVDYNLVGTMLVPKFIKKFQYEFGIDIPKDANQAIEIDRLDRAILNIIDRLDKKMPDAKPQGNNKYGDAGYAGSL